MNRRELLKFLGLAGVSLPFMRFPIVQAEPVVEIEAANLTVNGSPTNINVTTLNGLFKEVYAGKMEMLLPDGVKLLERIK